MDHKTFLDPYHPLSNFVDGLDRPQAFLAGGRWEVPIRSRRQFGANLAKPLQYTVGGWNVSWISTFDSGLPTSWTGAILTHPVQSIQGSLSKWFDTSAFAPLPPYTLPSLSPLVSWIRQPGSRNVDLNISKTLPIIGDRLNLEVGADFYHAFNHPLFGAPNTSPTSAAFGAITSQANSPRWIMLNGILKF